METGDVFYRCPVHAVSPESISFLSLYGFYRSGFLLTPGGIEAQPYRYLAAMRVIDAAMAEVEKRSPA